MDLEKMDTPLVADRHSAGLTAPARVCEDEDALVIEFAVLVCNSISGSAHSDDA
jgi:hypothetical protein